MLSDVTLAGKQILSRQNKDVPMVRLELEQITLTLPGRLVPLSLAGLCPGWFVPPPVRVLSGIDLQLSEGDRLAVVGLPGAGKTMLLRVLAGRLAPTSGSCEVNGPIVDLVDPEERLDLRASGAPHLIRLTGSLRSLPAQVAAGTTGLGELLDVPVGCCSPGMRWRLGFALATINPGEVVLADEALGRCDLAFRAPAERRLVQLLERSRVAVLVERDLSLLAQWCNKALWLERGVIRQLGPARAVLDDSRASLGQQNRVASLARAS